MANNNQKKGSSSKGIELVPKKRAASKKNPFILKNDTRKIVYNKECSPNTKLPNTRNSLLIK